MTKNKFIKLNKKTIKKKDKDGKNKEHVTFFLSPSTKKSIPSSLSSEISSRIKKMYIPKHLNNIQISKSPKHKVQIIGQDDKGRQQYFYAKKYADQSESRKYKILKNLSLIINKLETNNISRCKQIYNKLIKNKNYKLKKEEIIELINYFLLYHHIRIGNKQYLNKYDSTGISTLKPTHFNFNASNNNYCIVKFKGKKGVINNCKIQYNGNDNMTYINENNNNNLINNSNIKDIHYYIIQILKILKATKTKNDFMLDYNYYNPVTNSTGKSIIDTTDYKNYFLDKYKIEITPKMFRTWFANYYLVNYLVSNYNKILLDIKNKKTKTEYKKYIADLKKNIIYQISANLNNTPEICKKKYINNKFLVNVISRLKYYCDKCKKLKHHNNIKQRKNIHNFLVKELF
jgi:DNA topoisomerase IB